MPLEVFSPGTTIGRYKLLSRLASGGMAEVWLAEASGAGGFSKQLVVKTMLSHVAETPRFVEWFVREASLAARLAHENIVQVFDFGQLDGHYFIAMEYVQGRTLRQIGRKYRQADRKVDTWFLLRVIASICDALQYVHEFADSDGRKLGLVHRDVSPENIMVSFTGAVKLVDFGVAHVTLDQVPTVTNMLVGKCRYMAAERIRGLTPPDRRADIYALGIILYEMLTGVVPYAGENDAATLLRILEGTMVPPRTLDESIPEQLERIVLKAMAANPDERYATANDLSMALRRFLFKYDPEANYRGLDTHLASLFSDVEEIASNVRFATGPSSFDEPSVSDFAVDLSIELTGEPAPTEAKTGLQKPAPQILAAMQGQGARALPGTRSKPPPSGESLSATKPVAPSVAPLKGSIAQAKPPVPSKPASSSAAQTAPTAPPKPPPPPGAASSRGPAQTAPAAPAPVVPVPSAVGTPFEDKLIAQFSAKPPTSSTSIPVVPEVPSPEDKLIAAFSAKPPSSSTPIAVVPKGPPSVPVASGARPTARPAPTAKAPQTPTAAREPAAGTQDTKSSPTIFDLAKIVMGGAPPVAVFEASPLELGTGEVDIFSLASPAPPSVESRVAPSPAPSAKWRKPPPSPAEEAHRRFERGLTLLREKKLGEALTEWEAALTADPDNRVYQTNLKRLRD